LVAPPPPDTISVPFITHQGNHATTGSLTLLELFNARADYFDTRITGRAEVWAAVRLVSELVEQGSLAEAQAVLDAAGCTCPTGSLWGRKGGVYDEFGERYEVPVWCVARPVTVAEPTPREAEAARSAGASVREGTEDDAKERNGTDGVVLLGQESRGKAKAVEHTMAGREISVKARLSHSARDVVIQIGNEDNVNVLLQQIRNATEVHYCHAHDFAHRLQR
jgi:hypothetical protein